VLRGFLLFVLSLALVLIGAISLMPLLWRWVPQSVALVPAAPQFAAAAAILTACFLLLRARKAASLAFVVAAWNIVQVWPGLGDLSSGGAAETGATPLKLVSFNLWYRNADPAATLAYLAHSDADVIGLVETTPRLKAALAPLKVLYPYSVDCIGKDPSCEIMLLSKVPLQNAYAGKIDGSYPYVAEAEVDWGGRPVTVVMTHLSWPFLVPTTALNATTLEPASPELPNVPWLAQSQQAANLAAHVNKLPRDLVLLGDFNNASWSRVQIAIREATGLDNRGHYLPSWPAFTGPVFRLPIDQVFVRGGLRISAMRLGPSVGSDHLPVEAEVGSKPVIADAK
jgi:endonuclease/exonuclease/phosphatase (EEP) superfamily protein YafD